MAYSIVDEMKKRHEKELNELLTKQNNCSHIWKRPVYDPETKSEPYGSRLVHMGSDCWSEPEGYHDVKYDRWSRTCRICGKVEYTYKEEPIVVGKKPAFD